MNPFVKKTKGKHPFVEMYDTYNTAELQKALGHATHATLAIYASRCRKRNTYKIPAEWVIPLCEVTGGNFQPHQLRPDLYLKHWTLKP